MDYGLPMILQGAFLLHSLLDISLHAALRLDRSLNQLVIGKMQLRLELIELINLINLLSNINANIAQPTQS